MTNAMCCRWKDQPTFLLTPGEMGGEESGSFDMELLVLPRAFLVRPGAAQNQREKGTGM